jgi:DNA-binding beta-propeller fold protein YncE
VGGLTGAWRRDARLTGRPGAMGAAVLLALLLASPAAHPGGPRATGAAASGSAPAPGGIGTDVGGLAFDATGRLYVADRHRDRVVVLGPAGEVLGEIGAGRLDDPTGVAVAPGGDVLVTDAEGVTRFAADGTPVAAWDAEEPAGIAVAPGGVVYVSEPDRVATFSGAGAPLGAFAADDPRGIAVAGDGTL